MKKYLSKLTLAMVVALVAGLGFAAPAVADPVALVEQYMGLTKRLAMPEGTAVPTVTFTFDFAQAVPVTGGGYRVLLESERTVGLPTQMPTITIPAVPPAYIGETVIDGVHTYYAQNANALAGFTWPHAGQFRFVVSEVPSVTPALAANEAMAFSTAWYLVTVQVGNCPVNVGRLVPTSFMTYIGSDGTPGQPAVPGTGDTFTPNPDGKTYDLSPGTPGTPGTDGQPGTLPHGDHSRLVFTNNFSRVTGTDPGDLTDNPALAFSKTVIGENANMILQFAFDATLTIPAIALAPPQNFVGPVTATVTNAAGVPIADRAPVAFTQGATPGIWTAEFTLAHGEQLRFVGLPAGTTYSVTERATQEYAPTAVVTIGGTAGGVQGDAGSGNQNTALTVTGFVSQATAGTAPFNLAAFTNHHHVPPLMGLVIGSMPFMVALLGATVLLAMMVASRSRQRIEQLPIAY